MSPLLGLELFLDLTLDSDTTRNCGFNCNSTLISTEALDCVCLHNSLVTLLGYFLNTLPSRSISRPSCVPRPAASNSLCHSLASLSRTASSAALTRMPHFSYISIVAPVSTPVHFGTNWAASRGFPACNTMLKNGCIVSTSPRRVKQRTKQMMNWG